MENFLCLRALQLRDVVIEITDQESAKLEGKVEQLALELRRKLLMGPYSAQSQMVFDGVDLQSCEERCTLTDSSNPR